MSPLSKIYSSKNYIQQAFYRPATTLNYRSNKDGPEQLELIKEFMQSSMQSLPSSQLTKPTSTKTIPSIVTSSISTSGSSSKGQKQFFIASKEHSVKSRHYCYVCPKSLFLYSAKKLQRECQKFQKTQIQANSQKVQGSDETAKEAKKLTEGRDHVIVQGFQNRQNHGQEQNWQQILVKIRKCCQEFVGSHNFHNYSKNLRAKDPQAQRYIHRFQVDELDQENLVFNIVGQSFIYHQIRKMIGCIIMTFINNYPASYIPNTFFRNQIHMPLAPAAGLYLNSLSFQNYNQKKNIPEPLTFEDSSSISTLKQDINQYILSQGNQQWTEWVLKLKESIYHGIDYIFEDQKESSTSKMPQED